MRSASFRASGLTLYKRTGHASESDIEGPAPPAEEPPPAETEAPPPAETEATNDDNGIHLTFDRDELHSLTVADLRSKCKAVGLSTNGRKAVIISRLCAYSDAISS